MQGPSNRTIEFHTTRKKMSINYGIIARMARHCCQGLILTFSDDTFNLLICWIRSENPISSVKERKKNYAHRIIFHD